MTNGAAQVSSGNALAASTRYLDEATQTIRRPGLKRSLTATGWLPSISTLTNITGPSKSNAHSCATPSKSLAWTSILNSTLLALCSTATTAHLNASQCRRSQKPQMEKKL